MLSPLCLLLVAIVRVSVQQCTTEGIESILLDTVIATDTTNDTQMITINRTTFNCLATSQTIGVYRSAHVSVSYIRSDNPNELRGYRYTYSCYQNTTWVRVGQFPQAFDTRRNCSSCLMGVGIERCTR